MKIRVQNKKLENIIIIGLFFVFALWVTFISIPPGLINPVDHNFVFDFTETLKRKLFIWDDYYYFGSNSAYGDYMQLPYLVIYSLFELFGFNYLITNRLEFFLPVFLLPLSSYIFLTSILKEELAFLDKLYIVLTSTFFLTNFLIFGLYVVGLPSVALAYSIGFLILYLLRKLMLYGPSTLVLFLFPLAVLLTNTNLAFNVLFLIFVVLISLIYSDIALRQKLKWIFIFVVIWLISNFYWVLPLFYTLYIAPNSGFFDFVSKQSAYIDVLSLVKARYAISYLFYQIFNVSNLMYVNSDYSSYFKFFQNIYVYGLLSISVISILVLNLAIITPRRWKISISYIAVLTVFIIFIFLAKSTNTPFGNIYMNLFNSFPIFKMFRDSFKWMLFVNFAFVLISINSFLLTKNVLFKVFHIIFYIIFLLPWFMPQLQGKVSTYIVPSYYNDFSSYMNSTFDKCDTCRAVIAFSVVGPTLFEFTDGFATNNIIKFFSPIPVIDLFSPSGGPNVDLSKQLLRDMTYTDSDISILQKLGITHVYVQNDQSKTKSIMYSDVFKRISFGRIDVYEVPKSGHMFYDKHILKLSPSEYEYVENPIKADHIDIPSYFDPNWRLYVWSRNKSNITFIDYLLSKNYSVSSSTDVLTNTWKINNLSSDSKITLYFFPQALAFLGMSFFIVILILSVFFFGIKQYLYKYHAFFPHK